jgi:hypothetical protein
MDQRPQPLRLGLRTRCLNLFVRQRLPAALPDAARGKDLYQVCAVRFQSSYRFADLLWRELRIFNRLQ